MAHITADRATTTKKKCIPVGITKKGSELQSQLQGGQVVTEEERLTAAKPSIKCQYKGGPKIYAAKLIAIRASTDFNTLGLHGDDLPV